MSADNAFTRISPRQLREYRIRSKYKATNWLNLNGSVTILEGRDEEGAVHTADPELLPAVKANKTSCLTSGCHQVVHNVGELNKVKFWQGAK